MQVILRQLGDCNIRRADPSDLISVMEINLKTLPEHYSDYFYESLLAELPEAFIVAGVGMFSIMAAKKKKCTVFSLDINPVASKLCEVNMGLNKLAGDVISINGDATEIINKQLEDKSDRTLMLLPERSDEFLDSAIRTTKNGGIIHYYSHIHADKKADAGKLSEEHYLKVSPVKSEILDSKIVRPVGPRYYQTVVDVKISK